ncbi:MAG: magnesium/cobalt transporter CorA [Actinobacteria bacterium]|nr:magnesium/cobalt transporter CorA [Actinomycetota bacterium]
MITCRIYRDGHLEGEHLDPERVEEVLGGEDRDVRIWLDVESPSDEDFAMLGREFGLHELSMEDMRHRDQRPKVESFEHYHFIVLRPLCRDGDGDGELVQQEVHAVLGDRFLITLRYEPVYDLTEVMARWDRHGAADEERGPGFLLYVLLDEIVDTYLSLVEEFEDQADELEDLVFSEDAQVPTREVQQMLFGLKRDIVRFRRSVMPLRRVVDFFQEQPQVVTGSLAPFYRDVADHVVRCVELVDNVRDLLTALLEVRLSQVANRLNEVMKKLTSWAAIILLPTLIAGIYGMNFVHMPELQWRFGYPMALGIMAATSALLYVIFKKREWL